MSVSCAVRRKRRRRHINGSELLYVGGGLCCSLPNDANRGKEI